MRNENEIGWWGKLTANGGEEENSSSSSGLNTCASRAISDLVGQLHAYQYQIKLIYRLSVALFALNHDRAATNTSGSTVQHAHHLQIGCG